MFAKDLTAGMSITVNGSQLVTISEITRRDDEWVSNGVIRFRASDGLVYGLDRYARV